MSAYLLDSNILSDAIRHPHGPAARAIAQVGEDQICTSIVVAAELRFGAVKSGSRRIAERLEAVLATLKIHPFDAPADAIYALLRAKLEREGRRIGANDLLIAAHALSLGATLVTANVREFERVDGLPIENWLG